MTNFLIYPEINDQNGFPPAVNKAIATSPEIEAEISKELAVQVPPLVGPLVITELGKSSAPADAAASAVAGKLAEANIFQGASPITWVQSEVAFTFTDKHGNRFWIESGFDGKPTAHTIAILTEVLSAPLSISVGAVLGVKEISDIYDWAWVVTDQNDRALGGWRMDGTFVAVKMELPDQAVTLTKLSTDLQATLSTGVVTPAGIPVDDTYLINTRKSGSNWQLRRENKTSGFSLLLHTAPVIRNVSVSGANVFFTTTDADGTNSKTLYIPHAGGTAQRVIPYVGLIAHGDSMTHGMGGSYGNYAWPAVTANQLGIPFVNSGLSAQTSTEIATDQGGLKPTFTFAGNQIPTSGAVTLSNVAPSDGWRAGWLWSWTGYMAGVYGTLSKSTTEVWTFTRATAGEVVAAPAGTPFISEQGILYGDWIQTFWIGRNNVNLTQNTRDMDAMVSLLTPYQKRFLVFPIFNSTSEASGTSGYNTLMAINNAWAAQYPGRYVDTRRWIIDNGLAAAGITPTADDTTAISEDRIPQSLMADNLHLNNAGYDALGKYVATVITSKGWV